MSGVASQEFSGKSVEEATADGLRAMGLRAEEADVTIVQRGSRGLFGLGSEPAVVRIAPPATSVESAPPADASEDSVAAMASNESIEVVSILEVDDVVVDAADGVVVMESMDALVVDDTVVEATVVEEIVTGEPVAVAAAQPVEGDDDIADMASDMLSRLVELMDFECTVTASWRDADDITDERHLLLAVHGPEASGLIGRRGDTLENIQYLLRLMVNQRMHRWLNIIVDIEDYRAKRVEHLTHLAQRMADQVVESGRSQALEPMSANERRIVHLVLRDDERIFTESTGEGERRKVVIFPQH